MTTILYIISVICVCIGGRVVTATGDALHRRPSALPTGPPPGDPGRGRPLGGEDIPGAWV